MNIDEALKILNLNREYTEDELKREYRKLVIKYHPDKHSDNDKSFYEEKTKLLNEAKDILDKNIKSRNKNERTSQSSSNMNKEKYDNRYYRHKEELDKLKTKYKEEVRKEGNYIFEVDSRDKNFMKWKDNFLKVIDDFLFCIDEQVNVGALQINYDYFRQCYFELLVGYSYDCWKSCWKNSYMIDYINDFVMNKNDGIKNVRNKLIMTIQSKLDSEMEEFKSIDVYDEIKSVLFGIRNCFVDVCLYGYLDIDKAKRELKNKIVLEINKYKKRKQLIDNLIKYYGYPNKLVIELYNNILNEEKFNTLYNDKIDFKTKVKVRVKNIFSR